MASRLIQFEAGDDDERFFRSIAPAQLLPITCQIVSSVSMAASDPASVRASVDEVLKEGIGWMERTVKNAPNAKAAAERLGQNIGEGLNIGAEESASDEEAQEADSAKFQAIGEFAQAARFNMRQALYFCWIALAEDRRMPIEAGRIVRLAVSRQLAAIEELRCEILQS